MEVSKRHQSDRRVMWNNSNQYCVSPGTSVNGGEVCYTDYYTLEYCEYDCCGEDVLDRHCCTKQ